MKTFIAFLLIALLSPLTTFAESSGSQVDGLSKDLAEPCNRRQKNKFDLDYAERAYSTHINGVIKNSECKQAMDQARELCWGKIDKDAANKGSASEQKAEKEQISASGAHGAGDMLNSKSAKGQEKALGFAKECDWSKENAKVVCDAEEQELVKEGHEKSRVPYLKEYRKSIEKSLDDEVNCQLNNAKVLAAVQADAQSTMASTGDQASSTTPKHEGEGEHQETIAGKVGSTIAEEGAKKTLEAGEHAVASGAATNAARSASHGLGSETAKDALRATGKYVGENASTISKVAGTAAKRLPLVEPGLDVAEGVYKGNLTKVGQGVAVGAACIFGGELVCFGAGVAKFGYNYFNQPNCAAINDAAVGLASGCPMSIQSVNSAADIMAQK